MNRSILVTGGMFLGIALTSTVSLAAPPRLGAVLDYEEVMELYELDGSDVTDHYDAAGITAVVDLDYARFGVGLTHNFGNQIRFADGHEAKDDGYRIAHLKLQALGKYPFALSRNTKLWPAAGLRYSPALTYRYEGSRDRKANSAPNDLWVEAGAGLDVGLSPKLELTVALIAGYDLTPGMGSHAERPKGWSLGLDVGGLVRVFE